MCSESRTELASAQIPHGGCDHLDRVLRVAQEGYRSGNSQICQVLPKRSARFAQDQSPEVSV